MKPAFPLLGNDQAGHGGPSATFKLWPMLAVLILISLAAAQLDAVPWLAEHCLVPTQQDAAHCAQIAELFSINSNNADEAFGHSLHICYHIYALEQLLLDDLNLVCDQVRAHLSV